MSDNERADVKDPEPHPQPTKRPVAAGIENVLGVAFKVLDDGFVRAVDYLGDDSAIVQAARVSYGSGTRRARDDRALLRYLMRHRHTTPFEMCEVKLHVRVPMDVWRQWIRHRTASVNEYSTRYSVAIDAAQRTSPSAWRRQASNNRQGSAETLETSLGDKLSAEEAELQDALRRSYEQRLAVGVAREQARKDLPLSTYTEAYWKIDLHNLFNFLALRQAQNAQHEIRQFADCIATNIVAVWVPEAWRAHCDYERDKLTLSRHEVAIVTLIVAGQQPDALASLKSAGMLDESEDGAYRLSREGREFAAKLQVLGIEAPWKPTAPGRQ